MSGADNQTLALRDLAVAVVKAKGVLISEANAQSLYSYHDARLRIEYINGRPQVLDVYRHGASWNWKVLSVIWDDDGGDAMIVLHRTGSWEDSLRRLAKQVSRQHPFCAATVAAGNLIGWDPCCGRPRWSR